jgi:serine O-acetyltransferase
MTRRESKRGEQDAKHGAAPPAAKTSSAGDVIWRSIRQDVRAHAEREKLLTSFLETTILRHDTLEEALAVVLADKLATLSLSAESLRAVIGEALTEQPSIGDAVRADLEAVSSRDPACTGSFATLLYAKGFHALEAHRVAHWYWDQGRTTLAIHLQSRTSEVFGVDIHPAARIGSGVFIDHATSVVIGETAVVGDEVSMLHEVTLGGTGKETGDRHPKVRRGVLICAGAKVLGNVEVGEGSKIGAGSVVLNDVPPHCTVAGVPAVVVGHPAVPRPSLEMNAQLTSDGKAAR